MAIEELLTSINPMQAIGTAVLLLVCYVTISILLSYRRLAHVKGPFWATWTPFWLLSHTAKGDLFLACAELLKQYGSPVRVAPNIVVMNDPQDFRTMTAPKSPWTRGHWFEGMKLDPREDNILSMRDEKLHSEMRRKLIPGYTGHDVPTLELDVDDRVVELKELINKHIKTGKQFDFARVAHFFTLDVLTKIALGDPVGFLTRNEDVFDFIKNSEQFYPMMEMASNHPSIMKLLRNPLLAGFQPKPTDTTGLGAILGKAQQFVNDRLAPGAEKHADILGSFIKQGLSRVELQSETVLLMLGGSDSTSTSLRNITLHLLTNPRVYTKLQAEIDQVVAAGKASRPVITNSEAQELPYLRAVVMEGLRIHQPLVGLAGREAPKGGAVLGGIHYPAGTQVGINTYAMLRRADLFGDDADTFRPERWLEGDEAKIKSMEKDQSLVFGAGTTMCLGKSIAMMELRKAVFELLNDFDLALINPLKPFTFRANGVISAKDMWMRAYPRS